MKRFLILIVLVLAGCGEAEDTAKVNRCLEAGDVCVQINNALIISEQQGKLLNNLKLITNQQAEIIVGTYETKFVTGPVLSDTRLKENVEDKKPRKKKTTAKARDLRVDPAIGDDSNDGSTAPLKSIKQAIRIAKAGDTIHLKPVVYHQYAGFYGKRGEPGNPITLDGHGAVLEGSEAIQPASWTEVAPGLFKNDQLMPTLNLAILWRWFFLFDGKINRMGRVLKGKSEPFLKPAELKPGEWTFVGNHKKSKGGSDSDKVQGSFFLKIKPGQTLKQANIRFPIRSAGVQFSGENAHLVIRNLTATHQYNDGFNIHGDCRDVVFENIQAIECGDDGISAHETAQYRVDGFVSIGN
ncbi:MAG: hypothetical protein HOB29_00130, partial [Planctomycetaceae bacterium]|nr:hypothetical protein [Planctomycetaceae bacterium]